MALEKLLDYPTLHDDPLSDIITYEAMYKAPHRYALFEEILSSGKVAVCVVQQTPVGGHFEHEVVICGYCVEPTGFFKRFKSKKMRLIPENDRAVVRSEIIQHLSTRKFEFDTIKFELY